MEILERFTRPLQVNEADRPPVDLAADAAIRECQLDKLLPVEHQPLTGLGTVPQPPKKKVNGHPILK